MNQRANSLKASDVMRKEVLSLMNDSTLREAWNLFRTHQISGAPVVNRHNELVGVLSQHDLARQALNKPLGGFEKSSYYYLLPTSGESLIPLEEPKDEVASARVEKAMNPYVVTVSPDDSVATVVKTMKSHHVHRVIVTQGKKIVGLISTFDLLDLI